MPRKDPVESFGSAEDVANFLLHESFRYAHAAAAYEVAGELFGRKLENIELADPEWQSPDMPTSLNEWLINGDEVIDRSIDPKTAGILADAWYSSLDEACNSGIKLSKSLQLQSTTDIIGHVVNLTICLEGSLNRHLFFMRESKQLLSEYYQSIDRSELMPKILFCFKEQILGKTLYINRIKQLVSMRNKTVHYRVDSPDSLKPSVEDLIGIWTQLGQVFDLTYGKPDGIDVQKLIDVFTVKWVN